MYKRQHERDLAGDYIREHDNGYISKDNTAAIAELLAHVRDAARAGNLKSPIPDRGAGFDSRAEDLKRVIQSIGGSVEMPQSTFKMAQSTAGAKV